MRNLMPYIVVNVKPVSQVQTVALSHLIVILAASPALIPRSMDVKRVYSELKNLKKVPVIVFSPTLEQHASI